MVGFDVPGRDDFRKVSDLKYCCTDGCQYKAGTGTGV